MKLKKSEARILIFLAQTPPTNHYARKMSIKLEMDYAYVLQILAQMHGKEWLLKSSSAAHPSRVFYKLTILGNEAVGHAKELLAGGQKNGSMQKVQKEDSPPGDVQAQQQANLQ